MKILHFGHYGSGSKSWGGIESYVATLIKQMSSQNTIINLVSNDNFIYQEEEFYDAKVIKSPRLLKLFSTSFCPRMPFEAKKCYDRFHFDMIHLHSPDPMSHLSQTFLPKSIKRVITWHSDIVKQKYLKKLYAPFLKRLVKSASAIIVGNPNKNSFPDLYHYLENDDHKVTVIPFGVESNKFENSNMETIIKIKNRYKKPIIFAVGRHVYYKGFEYLIDAMHHISDAVLILGGTGPLTETLKRKVSQYKLEKTVYFVGRISDEDLIDYYHAAEVFCFPSIEASEAYGLVQVEAMLSGKPVVCCELNNGVTYVNQHEKTGLVVPPKNAEALAKALNLLLQNDALRNQLGNYARQRALQEFSAQVMAERTLQLYQNICKVP